MYTLTGARALLLAYIQCRGYCRLALSCGNEIMEPHEKFRFCGVHRFLPGAG